MISKKQTGFEATVLIGRFQPFHKGHLTLLTEALARGRKVVVVLGSAYGARKSNNPWSWQERAEMIRLAVSEEDASRIEFLPVRDYHDDAAWVTAVESGVTALTQGTRDVALVGFHKDNSSYYLDRFPSWGYISCEQTIKLDATEIRNVLYANESKSSRVVKALLANWLTEDVLDYVAAWAVGQPHLDNLRQEFDHEKAQVGRYQGPHPVQFLAVHSLVRCNGHVLLVRRGRLPGKGMLALPSGYLKISETLYEGAVRTLKEKTGLSLLPQYMVPALKAVIPFDAPKRSNCGRILTHQHVFELRQSQFPETRVLDRTAVSEILWVPESELLARESEFFEDQFSQLNKYLKLVD